MNQKGQNIIEYLLLVVAVVLVCLVFLRKHGPYSNAVSGSINTMPYKIEHLKDNIVLPDP